MKKRIASIILSLVMLLSLLPMTAFAGEEPTPEDYKNATYYVHFGTAHVPMYKIDDCEFEGVGKFLASGVKITCRKTGSVTDLLSFDFSWEDDPRVTLDADLHEGDDVTFVCKVISATDAKLTVTKGKLNWGNLRIAIGSTPGTQAAPATEATTIKLTQNLTRPQRSESQDMPILAIETGKNIILDLNGHVLNGRYLLNADSNENDGVIDLWQGSTLTVIDSNPMAEHNGYVDLNGLWHWDEKGEHELQSGETRKFIKGGIITGGIHNHNGCGVNVGIGATFNMYGGTICGNTSPAASDTGAVRVLGTFNMYGGTICSNLQSGVAVKGGTFNMYNGTICDNAPKNNTGGGVTIGSFRDVNIETMIGKFNMLGGTICNNVGGIYNYFSNGVCGILTLGGTAVVSGNFKGDEANDVQQIDTHDCDFNISTDTPPENGMMVGLYSQNIKVKGASEADTKYFFSDSADYYVDFNNNNTPDDTSDDYLELKAPETDNYAINVIPSENGAVTASAKEAAKDAEITLTVVPDGEYRLGSLTVTDANGGNVSVTENKFTMPDAAVTVTAVFEETESTGITTWSKLQNAINDTLGDAAAPAAEATIIQLTQDLTGPAKGNAPITVPEGKNIILDLNGYVLNRGRIGSDGVDTGKAQSSAISVAGTLTIIDSNTDGQFHKFTVLDSGLWVLDEDNGTEIVTGGVITGGTGTFVTNSYGGGYSGGGILVTGAGDLTIEDGSIIGNTAGYGGGIEVAATSSLTMHGGTVTGNTAAEACGGIDNAGTLKMKGKIIIKENVCESGVNNLGTMSAIIIEETDDPWANPSLANSTKIYAALVDASGQPVAGILTDSEWEKAYYSPNDQIFYDGSTDFYLTTHRDEGDNQGELEVAAVPDGYHTISLRAANGSLAVRNEDLEDYSGAIGQSGDKIFVTRLWPDTGYQLKSVSYYDGQQYTPIVKDEDGYYTFEMPDKDITVCAEYEQTTFDKLGQAVSGKSSAGVDGVFTVEDDPGTGIRTVTLLTDLSGGDSDAALEVPAGKNVVFDLNGHALNRGMIQKNPEDPNEAFFRKNEKGSVFLVNGTLTVIDSSPEAEHRFTKRQTASFPLTVLDEEAASDYIVWGGVITGGTGCLDPSLGALEPGIWQEGTDGPYSGGGIFIGETGVVNLDGGTVIGNACAVCGPDNRSDFGGGVLVKGKFNMNSSAVTGNAVANCGGGIYVTPTGSLTMKDSTVSDNKVNGSSFGGGIYCKGSMKIEDSVISGNSTEHSGGGIAVVSTDNIEIIDSDFADNFGPHGGALYVYNTNTTLRGVKFHGNQSGERGGGILVEGSNDGYYTTVLEDVDLCENIAYYDGGAIFVGDNAAVIIRNANIIGNNGPEAVLNRGELHLSGKVIIKDTVDSDNEQLVPSQNLVTINPVIIDDALDGSAIYSAVFAQNGWEWDAAAGGLTSDYTAKNPGAKVDDFFHYDGPSSFYMDLESNELVVKNVPDGSHSVSIPSIANGKVTADQYVVADSAEGNARTVTLTVTPDEGYQLKSLKYNDGQDHDITSAKSFTMPTANVTVTAEFEESRHSGGGLSSFSVESASGTKNGTFTVDKKNASAGSTVTITVAPDKGFTLETLTVLDKNGKEIEVKSLGNDKYSFKMPSGKVSISATFMEDNSMLNFFVDVKADDYFYDAVLWAAENDITKGTDAVHFSPNAPVTRAQVVTFLWRAAGCPEPVGNSDKFTDLLADQYYIKAVAWAIEQGITKGITDMTFEPETVCTRGQIVTFLARFAGVEDADTESVFSDVPANEFFAAAVKWAKDNGVTSGVTETTFEPYTNCNRAQVVTFLYRWIVK